MIYKSLHTANSRAKGIQEYGAFLLQIANIPCNFLIVIRISYHHSCPKVHALVQTVLR